LILAVFLGSLLGFSLLFVWLFNLEVKLTVLSKKLKEIR
jgi:hypothetical protein